VLAAGKGWVLPVLAMLAAKGRLRVAARGSGPGAKRRRPCPPLRAVPCGGYRDEGRPATTDAQGRCRAGVEQRADLAWTWSWQGDFFWRESNLAAWHRRQVPYMETTMNSSTPQPSPDATLEQLMPNFAKELSEGVMAAALVIGALYVGFCKWAEKAERNHHRSELLTAYKVRHKWKKSDVKPLLSIGVSGHAQRRMANLEGKGRPVVKLHRPLEKVVGEKLNTLLSLFRDDATPDERRRAIKEWPWWKHHVEALYRAERERAREEQIKGPHDHAERAVADALRVSQGTVRAICGEVRAMRREDKKSANFPAMLLTEYEGWMERGEVPMRFAI